MQTWRHPGRAKFPTPDINAPHATYRALAGEILDQARLDRELLVRHGLSDDVLRALEAAIAEFDASVTETNKSTQSHIAARAEMKALSDDIMRLVSILDGFNRYRFHHDSALIVAWASAKHVLAEPHRKRDEAPLPLTLAPAGVEPAA